MANKSDAPLGCLESTSVFSDRPTLTVDYVKHKSSDFLFDVSLCVKL
jgi:hypothetical protein